MKSFTFNKSSTISGNTSSVDEGVRRAAMVQVAMYITLFNNVYKEIPGKRYIFTKEWLESFPIVEMDTEEEVQAYKKKAPMWSVALYPEGCTGREADFAIGYSGAVLDVGNEPGKVLLTLADAQARMDELGVRYFLIPTARSTVQYPRFRIVVPFLEPVSKEMHREVVDVLMDRVGGRSDAIGKESRDGVHLWAVPSFHLAGAYFFKPESRGLFIMDARQWLSANHRRVPIVPSTPVPNNKRNRNPSAKRDDAAIDLPPVGRFFTEKARNLGYEYWKEFIWAAMQLYGSGVAEQLEQFYRSGARWDDDSPYEFNNLVDKFDLEKANFSVGTLCGHSGVHIPAEGDTIPKVAETREDEAKRLFEHTTEHLVNFMERVAQNRLSPEHKQALSNLCRLLAYSLFTDDASKVASPLPPGCGKTHAAISLCASLHKLGIHDQGVLYSANNINALLEFRNDLIEAGYPAEMIGLRVSRQIEAVLPQGVRNIQLEECGQYQVLLISHQKLRSRETSQKNHFTHFQQRTRLLIWDEEWLSIDIEKLPLSTVRHHIGGYVDGAERRHGEEIAQLKNWFRKLNQLLDESKLNPSKNDAFVKVSPLPFSTSKAEELIKALYPANRTQRVETQEMVLFLLNFAGRALRLFRSPRGRNNNETVWTLVFREALPAALKRVVVLDATAAISAYSPWDSSLTVADHLVGQPKDFSSITIYWGRYSSSRTRLEEHGADSPNLYLAELRAIIEEEGLDNILLLTMKDRDDSVPTTQHLQHIDVKEEDILTWGLERGVNSFRDKKVIVVYGIIREDDVTTKSHIMAIKRDVSYKPEGQEITQAQIRGQAARTIQGIMRGNGRNTFDGKAGEMRVYLFHYDETFIDLLREALPGVNIQPQDLVRLAYRSMRDRLRVETKAILADSTINEINSKQLRKTIKERLGISVKRDDAAWKALVSDDSVFEGWSKIPSKGRPTVWIRNTIECVA